MTSKGLVVAIHQPNFFPWLGYFDKLRRADVFVVLDDAQIQKTGGSWPNRVSLLVAGKSSWITAPILRGSGVQTIAETHFDESKSWREKMRRTLAAYYRALPATEETTVLVEAALGDPTTGVADFNQRCIERIAAALHIDTKKMVRASQLNVEGRATERLINLVRAVGGSTYLCGGGSSGYQEDALFAEAGIALRYQRFVHPTYAQEGGQPFVAGLSTLDALYRLGAAGTRQLFDMTESSSVRAEPSAVAHPGSDTRPS